MNEREAEETMQRMLEFIEAEAKDRQIEIKNHIKEDCKTGISFMNI